MVGLSVNADAGHLRHRLAYAVLLKVSGLLIPLGPYRAGRTHVVVVVQVGLGRPGRAFLGRQLAAGVEVYLSLHAVEVDVGNSAVGSQGVGASRRVVLGQAVSVRAGGCAAVAQITVRVQIQRVAFLRAVHARVVARRYHSGYEISKRHRDARYQVGVSRLAGVVKSYALYLCRGLADAVVLKRYDLLIPLSPNAGGRTHGIVVAQLHLARIVRANLGHKSAAGVKLCLRLDGVYLAVNYHAFAVDGDSVDVDVRLGKAVAVSARGMRAAVARVVARSHVESHSQFALGYFKVSGRRRLGCRLHVRGAAGGRVLDNGYSAASQQADAHEQRKYGCCQLLHFVYTSR